MSFYTQYELIDLLRDEGIKTFTAKEIATGRDVQVHLFTQPASPEAQISLRKLASLPPEARTQVLAEGQHEGTPYAVTLPLATNFRDWLSSQRTMPAPLPQPEQPAGPAAPPPVAADDPFAALFKKPANVAGAPAPMAPPAASTEDFRHLIETPTRNVQAGPERTAEPKTAETPTGPGGGEFTRMFQTPAMAEAPADKTRPLPVGDFTRMFETPKPADVAEPAAHLQQEPAGEFTRMFEAPPVQAQPAAAQPQAGEFTRMFEVRKTAPEPPPPTPSQPAPQPTAASQGAGEFTRMFQAPAPPSAPPSPAAPSPAAPAPAAPAPVTPSQPGEFTRFFESPLQPAPLKSSPAVADPLGGKRDLAPPPQAAPAGEFTRMFGARTPPGQAITPPPAAATPVSGAATQAFATPQSTAGMYPPYSQPPEATPSGPGDFTSVFSAPSTPILAQAAAIPEPPKKSFFRTYLPVILVFGVVLVLFIVLVAVFAMRKP